MSCPVCDSTPITFAVPAAYAEYVSADMSAASFCPRCLTLETAGSNPDTEPDFSRVCDAFPTRPDRAVPLAIALGLCSSLVTNRDAIESLLADVEAAGTDPLLAIESLLADVEAAGTDPLLAIDRLRRDPGVEPAIDLERRAHQLEQLAYHDD